MLYKKTTFLLEDMNKYRYTHIDMFLNEKNKHSMLILPNYFIELLILDIL